MASQSRTGERRDAEALDHPDKPVLRVLIADGNPDAADSHALLLTVLGHEVEVARSGPEALDAARAFHPDLLLAEIVLPGFDGLDLAGRLRDDHHRAGTVLVALTVFGDPASRRRVSQAGYHHHLVKPVEPDALLALLDSIPAARPLPLALAASNRLAVAG